MIPNGWKGKLLKVDLSRGSIRIEDISIDILLNFIGGRGFGMRLMQEFFMLDPLDPEMPLIFSSAPLSLSNAYCSSRISLVSKSPLTGTVFESSAGSDIASSLKGYGFDAIIVSGKSLNPVIIEISNTGVIIKDSQLLAGKSVAETFSLLDSAASVLCIGKAGEQMVRYASIAVSGGEVLSRGGLGAVMGSKNLKAIVVKKCVIESKPVNPALFQKASKECMRLFKASPALMGEFGISEYGTAAFIDLINQRRMLPSFNFRETFSPKCNQLSAVSLKNRFVDECSNRWQCPIQCLKKERSGIPLPGFETLASLGTINGISDLEAVMSASSLCYEYGIDPISAGVTIALYGENRGEFAGNDEILKLLDQIASRRNIGDELAEGARRYGESKGSLTPAITVKSLEMPPLDPRGAYGIALSYCTSNHGASHTSAFSFVQEILRKPVPVERFSYTGKARLIKSDEDTMAAADSISVCRNALIAASLEEYSELLTSFTGVPFTASSLIKLGEKIFMTERWYNCNNGFSSKDDILPDRFFGESGSSGDGIDIKPLNREFLSQEIEKYYFLRGLNKEGLFTSTDFNSDLP